MKDHYQILELEIDASPETIKEQYRFLVQAWHPDKFPNSAQKLRAEEKLKDINAAYEVLRNPVKRVEYDNLVRYEYSSRGEGYRAPKDSR
jgi:curved DNA-binding protein